MKIRNSSRITAIVLALVMLLPLISIPTFAADPTVLYEENFDKYQEMTPEQWEAAKKTDFKALAGNAYAQEIDGKTVLTFPIASAANVEGNKWYGVQYYLYTDNYKHATKTATALGHTAYAGTEQYAIESYNPETHILVLKNPDDQTDVWNIEVTPAAEASLAAGKYGTFKGSEVTRNFNGAEQTFPAYTTTNAKGETTEHPWVLATGEYAACNRFGDGSVIDAISHIWFGQRTYYAEGDAEVEAGIKNVGDLKAEAPGISYEDNAKVVVQLDAYIEPDSLGTLNNQLNYYTSTTSGAGKVYDKTFTELFDVNLSTGALTGVFNGCTMTPGEWTTLTFICDLENGLIQGLFDGKVIGNATASGTNLHLSGWSISKVKKAEPTKLQGSWNIDNIRVLTGDAVGGLLTYNNYSADFESFEVGAAANSGFSSLSTNYKVQSIGGTKALAIVAKTARDESHKINNEFFSSDMGDKLTMTSSYYIPTGAQHQLQTQLASGVTGVVNDAVTSKSWQDLFVIHAKDGAAHVAREGGNRAGYPVPFNEWFTVTVEFTLSNATFDIYVDDNLALANQTFAAGFTSIVSFAANSFIFAKENKVPIDEEWATGTIYVDNLTLKKGECGIAPKDSFDLFAAWNDDVNGYLVDDISGMNGAFAKGGGYSYPSSAAIILDEDQYITGVTLDIASDVVELTPDDPATPDVNEQTFSTEGNKDKMLRPQMPGFDFSVYETVILNATYNVSEDAEGKVQIELYDSSLGKWQSLYIIDASAATVNGAAFTKGEDFIVTTVIHANGNAQVYLNNLLVGDTNAVNVNGLNGAEWSVMKVMNYCDAYAGQITLTAATIDTEYAEALADHPLYLYGQEGMFDLNTLASVMTAYNGASIRLYAPHGLRFATEINTEVFAAIASDNMKIGTIIAPKDYVDLAADFTKADLSELNYVTSFIDVQAELGNYYKGEGTTAALPEGDYMVASIVNIKETNLEKEFVARGYIEFTVAGETYIYYAELDEDVDYGRTVAEVAAAALESGDYTGTAAEAILNSFIPQ